MNKKVGVIIGILVLVLGFGGFFFVSSKNTATPTPTPFEGDTIETLSPEEIGLELLPRADKKAVKIVVNKVSDIRSLEYEITYEADIPANELPEGETGGRVERGFSGEAQITSADKKYESKYLDLGSCSRNVCRYDTNVEEVKIVMKVVKKDGKIYQVEDSVTL